MDFKKIAEEISQKILSYNRDTSGWRVAKTSKKITVSWKPSKEYGGNLYRGEGVVKEAPAKLIQFMYLPEHRTKWDKSLQIYKLLQRIDADTFICHTVTHSFGMGSISPRDFVDLVHIKVYEGDVSIVSSVSVEYPQCSPSSSCIRGYNHPCGYVCSPLPENPSYSRLVVFVQPELRGNLPRPVIESALPTSLVNLISDLKDGIKSPKSHSSHAHKK
ncbi:stAR-related lipid transfer protein 6 isoform X1 [Tachyglossus aculeatus]|uniref:stAR-related lipid transfer protein 6 isoform X1 n=1 Tax=Tachyglossus aculeatus TaxID=9261 RepID=UPI0018F52487|nr:stAR-related lipid transfer protein 6 isoform X1 [Tachyglossus aculeatus]XP_038599845.1 stAR-related lipid transfer protein 6 isoform X1 [Tachyglossus aculeatus]